MAPRKLFGSLNLAGNVGKGENPNGLVQQTSNGTWINRQGADGDDYTYRIAADGPRWNKTEPEGKIEDRTVARPTVALSNRKR
jgi:hypothetical protein